MKILRISFFLMLISVAFQVRAQDEYVNVPIVFQNSDTLNLFYRARWSMIIDGERTLEGTFSEPNVNIPVPDSLVQLSISGGGIQPFYNEYTPENLEGSQEIPLYFKSVIRGATPRFFRKEILNPDIQVKDSLEWFVFWIGEDERVAGYELWVYQSEKLRCKEKRLLKKLHKKVDDYMGDTTSLVFMNQPYSCSDIDPFNYRTRITKEFIEKQNTVAMMELANNFSIVLVMVRKYKDD